MASSTSRLDDTTVAYAVISRSCRLYLIRNSFERSPKDDISVLPRLPNGCGRHEMPLSPLLPHVRIRVECYFYFLRVIIVIAARQWTDSLSVLNLIVVFWYLYHTPVAVASGHGGRRATGHEDHKALT